MHGDCQVQIKVFNVALENWAMYCHKPSRSPSTTLRKKVEVAIIGLQSENLAKKHAQRVLK